MSCPALLCIVLTDKGAAYRCEVKTVVRCGIKYTLCSVLGRPGQRDTVCFRNMNLIGKDLIHLTGVFDSLDRRGICDSRSIGYRAAGLFNVLFNTPGTVQISLRDKNDKTVSAISESPRPQGGEIHFAGKSTPTKDPKKLTIALVSFDPSPLAEAAR